MRRSALALALTTLLIPACDSSSPGTSPSAAQGVSAAPAPPPAPTAEAMPPPDDLDVASAQKALKCATDAKSGACGVLAKYSTCTPWNAVSPSGDARYVGRGTLVEGAKSTESVVVLRSKRVPLNEVGPGQLGVKIGLGEITKEDGSAFDQSGPAIRSFERSDAPGKANATIEYVKQRTQWTEAFANKTVGGQVYAIMKAGTFLCQGARQSVLMVQKAGSRTSNGDGLYAELWQASW
ncbi:MAG: hypothetical protein ABJE95_26705 [Byssovorax sp.]